ncbi:hypothetical protein CGRA01v4_09712 [Colletotrichum graminicola]|nr:hypothetical protein CGRA01v4_09712 [Colletotrichum graminicola]
MFPNSRRNPLLSLGRTYASCSGWKRTRTGSTDERARSPSLLKGYPYARVRADQNIKQPICNISQREERGATSAACIVLRPYLSNQNNCLPEMTRLSKIHPMLSP